MNLLKKKEIRKLSKWQNTLCHFLKYLFFLDKKKRSEENNYWIWLLIVGKCWSQVQTVVCGSGHGQNHHKCFSGSHHWFCLLKNFVLYKIINKININKIILIDNNNRIGWRKYGIYIRMIDIDLKEEKIWKNKILSFKIF